MSEKIVWQSKGGGVAGHHPIVLIALALLGLWSFGGCCTPIFLIGVGEGIDASHVPVALGSLVWPAVFAAIAVPLWVMPRLRPMYFVTPTHLIAKKVLGGERRIPLEGLAHAERKVVVYQGRYGPQEVVTHRLLLQFAGGRREDIGPIADVDALIELLSDAVITQHLSLDALPGIHGEPAPAEVRTDVLLAAQSSTGGMAYGPLFVGPTRLIRFTERLEPALLGRLYTIVGGAIDAEEAEIRVVDFLRNPSTGHALDVPRASVKTTVDRDTLYLKLPEREEQVTLAQKDADRLRTFLRAR